MGEVHVAAVIAVLSRWSSVELVKFYENGVKMKFCFSEMRKWRRRREIICILILQLNPEEFFDFSISPFLITKV